MAELTWNAIEALAISRDRDRAFQRDFDSIRELVFKLSYALTLDHSLAEDLAQDVLIKIWQHRERLASFDQPEAWIAKVVANKAKSLWRRRPKWVPIPPNAAVPGEQDPQLIELRTIIASLKDDFREVILLVAVYGFSYAEAGQALGIPEGTVASRFSHAKKELQRRMGE
ncbi:MAG: sigma-70 family RNA polymerase sigma factor [Armatimonadetes bacterium]|nr:sigma-70 family RNA polymerase sigma factor [Armatimonadota bacterium]MBS1725836.1 RNA polymerase sigma factor [Armatimonadota bacterium]